MPFKFDADGHVVLQEVGGQKLPVFVHPDGKEAPFDGEATLNSIRARAEQSQRVEGENKTLKEKLKSFEGIEDAEAAKKALETIKNIDDGKLIAAGKVEEIKAAAQRAAQEQVAAANKTHAEELARTKQERDKAISDLYAEMIGGSFANSPFVKEQLVIPPDMAQSRFGGNFKVEDGKRVGYDNSGNKIFSRTRPGELAEFDEALEMLVDQYQYRDHIRKGTGASGSGAGGSGGGGGTQQKGNFGGTREERKAALISRYPDLAKP